MMCTALSGLLLLCVVSGSGQKTNAPQSKHVTITIQADGTSSFCMEGVDLSCCPAYVASVNENGIVKYLGLGGTVKIKGERTQAISPDAVHDLVAEILRINFFSLEDEYRYKKMPDGAFIGIDRMTSSTISVDLNGKRKSIFIFYGEPLELTDLRRKLFDALQIAQYVRRQ